jgi:hypothetical protein
MKVRRIKVDYCVEAFIAGSVMIIEWTVAEACMVQTVKCQRKTECSCS